MGEPTRNSGGIDLLDEIGALVGFEGRAGGTDAERRAAQHLANRLKDLGRDAGVEPIRIWPAFASAHLVHALAGVIGSVLSVYVPIAGFALVLIAAVSAFGDLTGGFFLVRRALGARASQNVISVESDDDKPGQLFLVASYDARRGSTLFGERLRRWPTVFFWSLMVILVCTIPRLVGVKPGFLTVIQFIPTVILIASLPLLIDAALSEIEQGANWNASGVATVLELAERYGGRLENFDLSILLTGASWPVPLGMRSWLRRHKTQLDPETTVFVCLESAGHGTPHYALKEGLILPARLHPTLTVLCEQLESGQPYTARGLSGAYQARASGLPAIRISSLGAREFAPDTVDPDALARTRDFISALLERIDEEIGPKLP